MYTIYIYIVYTLYFDVFTKFSTVHIYIYIYIYILHNLRLVSNFKGYSFIFLRDIDDDQDVLYKF